MKRLGVFALLATACAMGCTSPARLSLTPQEQPGASVADAFNRQVHSGCYLCLADVLDAYSRLPRAAQSTAEARAAVGRAALMLLFRIKELGIPDVDRASAAESVARANAGALSDSTLLLQAADALPWNTNGVGEALPASASKGRRSNADLDASERALADRWRRSDVDAYAYLAVTCTLRSRPPGDVGAILERFPTSPLVRYRVATCGAGDEATLRELLAANPRFHEIHYFLGALAANADRSGSEQFEQAWRGIPNFTAARFASAEEALSNEEFDACRSSAADVLRVVPGHRKAMMLMLEALSRSGRHPQAVAVGNALASGEWYLGDVHYWIAWNELQLGHLDIALDHAAIAQRYGASSRVWALTGLIHSARHDAIAARDAFNSALDLDPGDCDVRFELAGVFEGLAAAADAHAAYAGAATCYAARRSKLDGDIDILSSDMSWAAADGRRFEKLLERTDVVDRLERASLARAADVR